jgi:two-component system NtrC family sensor kinase
VLPREEDWCTMSFVKPGLRLQILLLLGGVLIVTFVPLFFAVATYTRLTLHDLRLRQARAIGRTVAGQVSEARAHRRPEALSGLLGAQIGESGVEAIGLYDLTGNATTRVGGPDVVRSLPERLDAAREAVEEIRAAHGPALLVVLPDARGAVAAVLRTDDAIARVAPLVNMLGLNMGLIALGLLVLAYFALTRLLVRPLVEMSAAAERVAAGARRLELPERGPRELLELGSSLRTMTEKLIAEEEALRRKIHEVEEATRHLSEAQDRLVRSERLASVGRLAAGLAHEVGNPIAAIIGMQELLLEGGLTDAESRDFLDRMRKETERINRILRDLLQFARPAAPDTRSGEPGNVEVAVHDTVTLVSPQKSMKAVNLAVDVHPGLPLVPLPREQLIQVLLNLLLNAADACGQDGHVAVKAEPHEGGVRLSVEDDGPGIAPEVADRLFEPFVTTKDVGKGTGLGLAVCRGLVESAGGSITVDTTTRLGARFVIDLPRATP